jgi:hypothetical protein
LVLEPHQAGDDQDEADQDQGDGQPRHGGRRRRLVVAAIAAAVALVWAGLAFWPSSSTGLTIALYQAGEPDTLRVQRLGAASGRTFRHPELEGDGAIAGPVSIGRTIVVVRANSVWTLPNPGAPAHRVAPGCRVLPSDDAERMWVVSCGGQVTIRAFDLAGHPLTAELDVPPGYDNALSISADGVALLASSTLPHPAVIVWDSTSGTGRGATDQEVTPVSPDMAVTQTTGSTQLFDVHTQRSWPAPCPPMAT